MIGAAVPNQPLPLYRKDIIVAAALLPEPPCLSHCIFSHEIMTSDVCCLPMILVLVEDRFTKILESTVAAKVVDACAIQDDYLNYPYWEDLEGISSTILDAHETLRSLFEENRMGISLLRSCLLIARLSGNLLALRSSDFDQSLSSACCGASVLM